MGIREML